MRDKGEKGREILKTNKNSVAYRSVYLAVMSLAAGESIFPERIMFQAQKLKDAREAVRDKVRSGGTFVRPATVLEIKLRAP